MASTLAHGLNHIATQQIKQLIGDFRREDDDYLYSTVSYPLIYATPANEKKTSPFVMVNPVGTTASEITYGRYTDLNKDKRIIKTITKYFLYKILDKWLYHDYRNLLAFVNISDSKTSLIRNMNDYKPESVNSDSAENIEKKIEHLEKILINRELVRHVLKKIIRENNIQWTQLNKHKSTVKKVLKKYLYTKLKEAVESIKK
jgi:hypothetical protein